MKQPLKFSDNSSIPVLNPYFSWAIKGDDFAFARLCGRTKLLKCSTSFLKEVLELVDGKRSYTEIFKLLSKESSSEDIDSFLIALIKEGIIIETETIKADRVDFPLSITVIGNGILADTICQMLSNEVGIDSFQILPLSESFFKSAKGIIPSDMESLRNVDNSFFIICPDKATYGSLVTLNNFCLIREIPFFVCYYDGKTINMGPAVIPWKTPCFGCLIEHDCSSLTKEGNVDLTPEDVLPLFEAWPIPETEYNLSVVRWVASYIISDVIKFQKTGKVPYLIKRQILVPPRITHLFYEVTFEPITTCQSCSGMMRKKPNFISPISSLSVVNEIVLENRPTVYERGGQRSVSREEAKKVIDRAMKRIDYDLEFERVMRTALDEVLFRYCATIVGKYNSQLPFLIPEKNLSRGKGFTEEQAYLSAAFEMFERLSATYHGDVEIVRATYKEVKDLAINLTSYIGETFFHGVVDSFHEDTPIDWVWGYSLVHNCPKLVPASIVFFQGAKFLGHFFENSSGGLAAGAVIEDAILQALLEVIEHDSWMTWQANVITTPEIRLETIQERYLKQILEHIQHCGFRVIIRNYATDLSIPVFRVWIVNDQDYSHYAYCGFGANLNTDIALERAISEANLAMFPRGDERRSHYHPPNAWHMVNKIDSLFGLFCLNRTEIIPSDRIMDYSQLQNQSTGSVSGDIQKIISLLRESIPDIDVISVDLTKEVFGVPVVKIIAGGGLQRFAKPIITAHQRLYEMPIKLGYRKKKLTYKELYLGPFAH